MVKSDTITVSESKLYAVPEGVVVPQGFVDPDRGEQ
jgi:hypothetical protein